MSSNDKGKGKVVEPPRRRIRGGSSRGRRGRGPLNIPLQPPQVGNEFDELFSNEEIPHPETLETVGGERGASLSLDDILNDEDDEEIHIEIPIAEAERFLDEENERDQGNPRPSSSRSTGFAVDVEDPYGNVSRRTLDVHTLSQEDNVYRVIVPWNVGTDQPIGSGGHLLNRFLSQLGGNWGLFPIYFLNWKKVPDGNKDSAFKDVVQKKFKLRAEAKRYVKMKMGEAWKSRRGRLYDEQNGDGTMPLQQLIENVPDGVEANDWAAFVQYRRSPAGQVLSQRNTRSRAAQRVNHTGGSKTFAVRFSEMQEKAREENRQADYGQLWTVTHRHKDGTPTSDEAEEIIARIEQSQQELRASQTPESQGSIDPTAALKAAVGPVEHPGRVRGFGLGARPSMVYGKSSSSSAAGASGSSMPPPDAVDAMIAEKVAAQVAEKVAAERARNEARNRRMQESLNSWFATQRHSWQSLAGALTELLPNRRFPSPEPPPPFIFEDSPSAPPPPPPPRPEPGAGQDDDDVTSGRARVADERGPPESGPDHRPPDS